MPKKKSIKKAADDFVTRLDAVDVFIEAASTLPAAHLAWVHDYAIIRAYREFETLVLQALVGAINNNTETLSTNVGIKFPRHMTDEVCEYLVVGNGFFDFKGRDGLIATLKRFVPADHYMVTVMKDPKYREALERLCALRNYAAHGSAVAKKKAKEAVGAKNIGSAGSWLKVQGRLAALTAKLKAIATDVKVSAPY